MTDKDRMDLLERVAEVGANMERKGSEVRVFTVPSQHVAAPTLREALDIVAEYESGKRCWECEHWSRCHKHRERQYGE